jgi:hypothetical protein
MGTNPMTQNFTAQVDEKNIDLKSLRSPEPSTISTVSVVTEEECVTIRKTLEDLREHWISRHPVAPFYTLGASNYFDLAYNPELPYYRMAQRYNPILRDRLGWIYDRLVAVLSAELQAPVEFRDSLALPGFHIFLAHPAFEHPRNLMHRDWFKARYDPDAVSNPIHCDTPHLLFNWGTSYEGVDFKHPISFTLAISLPQAGAGMHVWDLHRDETLELTQPEVLALLDSREKQLYRYQVGSMALHSGFYYHQVAPFQSVQPTDARITLQGHGICCQGRWQLYW